MMLMLMLLDLALLLCGSRWVRPDRNRRSNTPLVREAALQAVALSVSCSPLNHGVTATACSDGAGARPGKFLAGMLRVMEAAP